LDQGEQTCFQQKTRLSAGFLSTQLNAQAQLTLALNSLNKGRLNKSSHFFLYSKAKSKPSQKVIKNYHFQQVP
jgi:hypothetical protein